MDRIQGACFGGGGGGSSNTPVEDANNLQSSSTAKMLFAISEGEIKGPIDGVRSVYLNDVPVQGPNNADGTAAYNYPGMPEPIFRSGTPNQEYIPDFPDQETQVGGAGSGSPVRVKCKSNPTDGSITFNVGAQYDAVRVCIGIPALASTDTSNGNMHGSEVELEFWVSYNGSAYQLYKTRKITGKTTSRYQFTEILKLRSKGPGPWVVKVSRVTADSTSSNLANETWLDSHTLIVDTKLTFPNTALLGVKIDAKSFGSIPTVSAEVMGLLVRLPNNYTPPIYHPATGSADAYWEYAHTDPVTGRPTCYEPGVEFSDLTNFGWTNNPAWILYDMLTDDRYGLGDYIDEWMVDKWALYQVGRYCDELIPNGYPAPTGPSLPASAGLEPRFACSCYIQSQADAYQVIQSLASIYRGMTYWAAGGVSTAQDKPTDPMYLFTPSNVVDGMFSYTSTSRRARRNVALVAWNDPSDGYKQKIEYVADQQAILEMGRVNEAQITAFGCTSRGQAHRLGKWTIYTDYYEREAVTFKAGFEGLVCRPGDVILVHDTDRLQVRLGGRILHSTGVDHTLDAAPASGTTLYVIDTDGNLHSKPVISIAGDIVTTAPFSPIPDYMAQWIIATPTIEPKIFRVLGVKEDKPDQYEITALEHNPSKYDYVDLGGTLTDPNDGLGGNGGGGNPNPGDSTKPAGLVLSSYLVVRDDTVETNVLAQWTGVANATEYSVEWRRNLDNWVPAPPSSSLSSELTNVVPDKYSVRVAARVNTKLSNWAAKSIQVNGDSRDDYIVAAEKPKLIAAWAKISTPVTGEYANLVSQANNAGVSHTAFDTAYNDLNSYLTDGVGYVYVYSSTSYPVAGWNVNPGLTVYLGRGGWRNWETWWELYRAAVEQIKLDILNAINENANAPTDTFRPLYLWNFDGNTMAAGAVTSLSHAAATSPNAETAISFTTVSGTLLTFVGNPNDGTNFDIAGKNGYVMLARVRKVSGTWLGRCKYSTDRTTYPHFLDAAGFSSGAWSDVAWDLRLATSNIGAQASVKAFALDFTSTGGVVEVDWVAIGTYGAGSKADYDNAISWSTTNALLTSNFNTIIQAQGLYIPAIVGSLPALPNALYPFNSLVVVSTTGVMHRNTLGSWVAVPASSLTVNSVTAGTIVAGVVGAAEIAANSIYSKHIVLANWDNLIPNAGSEMNLTGWPSGCIESAGVWTTHKRTGTRARNVTVGTPLVITNDISVVSGEVYSFACYGSNYSGPTSMTKTATVYWKDYAGTVTAVPSATWSDTRSSDSSWYLMGGQFTIPDGAKSIYVQLSATGPGGYIAAFDDFYLRKAADASLIVDGSVSALKLTAGAVQTYHLAVGPNYQFQSLVAEPAPSYSKAIASNLDGTFGKNNSTWNKFYVDAARYYPAPSATIGTNTFEANFSGSSTNARGIVFNLNSNGSGATGYILYQSDSQIKLAPYTTSSTSNGTIGSAVTGGTVTYARQDTDKLSVVVTGSSPSHIMCYCNGVKIIDYDTTVAPDGGYAGLYLDAALDRVWGIGLGRGFVTIQDGTITADKLSADLAVVGVIRSPTYNGNATTVCTNGYKVSGSTYTAKLADGTTTSASAEFGDDVIIGGYKALTMKNKVFNNVKSKFAGGRNSYYGAPADTSEHHAGWGNWSELQITPLYTGNILVMFSGWAHSPGTTDTLTLKLRYGTGTPPTAGSAGAGTVLNEQQFDYKSTYCLQSIVTGAAIGTPLWFDLTIQSNDGTYQHFIDSGASFSAVEL